jgi:Cu/Zn superoxide dismutase
MSVRRTSIVLPTAAVAAAFASGLTVHASAAPAHVFAGHLVDLSAITADPFGGASAHLVMTPNAHGTLFHLRVDGIDRAVAGHRYGAHLHVGPCVAGDAAAAGPHYNVSTTTPPSVSDQTEVWLDFTATTDGTGAADTTVPFLPTPGTRSVVIHAEATGPDGTAGPRLVCLPVAW